MKSKCPACSKEAEFYYFYPQDTIKYESPEDYWICTIHGKITRRDVAVQDHEEWAFRDQK